MNRIMHHSPIMAMLIFATLSAITLSCDRVASDWKKAERENSVSAYEQFVERHPTSPFSAEARSRIETERWRQAQKSNSVEAYEEFLVRYPASKFLNEARSRVAELKWQRTRELGTLDAYEDFIQTEPTNPLADKAKRRLGALKWKKLADGTFVITSGIEYRWEERSNAVLEISEIDGAVFKPKGTMSFIPTFLQSDKSKQERLRARRSGEFYIDVLADAAGTTWVFPRAGQKFFVLSEEAGLTAGLWFTAIVDGATVKFGAKRDGITVKGFEIKIPDRDLGPQ